MYKREQALKTEVLHEIEYLLKYNKHPIIHEDIDIVWVFSGPGTYLTPLEKGERLWMKWMDKHRILYGVAIVRKVTAKRLHKSQLHVTKDNIREYGPFFLYNGRPNENTAILKALQSHTFPLPEEKVVIIDHVHKTNRIIGPIGSTLDQIRSFSEEHLGANKGFCRIALVSHAEHFPRILRYLEQYKPIPSNAKVEVFSLKPPQEGLDAYNKAEINKVWKYFKNGELSWDPFPLED